MAVDGLLQGIDTVIIRVSDYDASKLWYSERLELSVLYDDASMKLAVMDTSGPTSLTLWQTESRINFAGDTVSFPIFRTPDAIALRRKLLQRGIDAGEISTDSSVTYFQFRDPDGNVLEACQVHG